ncbi:MAG TPA: hypothetical protein ENK18_07470 [Deltaproteobacteria bacterium]|nr:hypothetical protein [Deltaproteobacteria bacterium]
MSRSLMMSCLIALAAACGGDGKETSCDTEGAFSCDGQLLMVCTGGVLVQDADCDVEGGTCHAAMGHCMEDDTGMSEM